MTNPIAAVVAKSNAMAAKLAIRVIEGNMTAKVKIVRGGEEAMHWDPTTHEVIVDPQSVIWQPDPLDASAGIAAIKTVTGPVTMSLGDEPQYFQSTYISVPLRAPIPEVDDIVTVVTAPDPKLVGRSYRVVDVEMGGQLAVVHRMQVVGIQPGRYWRQP